MAIDIVLVPGMAAEAQRVFGRAPSNIMEQGKHWDRKLSRWINSWNQNASTAIAFWLGFTD
jgi:hypothetical protein